MRLLFSPIHKGETFSSSLTVRRCDLQRFLKVIRRAGLLSRKAITAWVSLEASAGILRLRAANAQVEVQLQLEAVDSAFEAVVDAEFLKVCSGKEASSVTLSLAEDEVTASWFDADVPRSARFPVRSNDSVPPAVADPEILATNEPHLLDALREAQATTDPESRRFALACVQLRSPDGRIAATDSRQLLVQRGYQFPWAGDRLMQITPVFRAKEIDRLQEVRTGEAGNWIAIQAGPWKIAHAVETEGRFPNVDLVIPSPSSLVSSMSVETGDARFVLERPDKLPWSDTLHEPVTVELNGSVAIRSRQEASAAAVELVLSRTQRNGDEYRLQMDRRYLGRALKLGLRDVGFTGSGGPCVARDAQREYVWMGLGQEDVIPASDVASRLLSEESVGGQRKRLGGQRSSLHCAPLASYAA